MDYGARSEVALVLTARNLRNRDLFSKSDPFCIVSVRDGVAARDGPEEGFVEVGRTEVINDTLSPEWTQQVKLTYFFEAHQEIRFDVRDADRNGASQSLGLGEAVLGTLVSSPGMAAEVSLSRGGKLVVRAEELADCSEYMKLQLRGAKLKNKDGLFGKSDPFVVLKRINEDGSWSAVWKSDVVMNNLNPTWKPAMLSVKTLANGDPDRPLRLEIYDWDRDGSHDSLGFVECSLRDLAVAGQSWPVRYKSKQKGTIFVVGEPKVFRLPTFLDYLAGGCQINVTVGIDFTGSNGHPRDAGTLHSLADPPNQYQTALRSVLGILEHYDHDKSFPVYGFGARKSAGSAVSHCFDLGDPPGEKAGVEGVMRAYEQGMQGLTFSGPTLLGPLLGVVSRRAKEHHARNDMVYTVLLVLCDGVVNDIQRVVEALCDSADDPLSVIIVGIGDADFADMEYLDGDAGSLKDARGRVCDRDIVQFVPLREMAGPAAGARLAAAVLEELPHQALAYFSRHGIRPRPPRTPAVEGLSDAQTAMHSEEGEPKEMADPQDAKDAAMQRRSPRRSGRDGSAPVLRRRSSRPPRPTFM